MNKQNKLNLIEKFIVLISKRYNTLLFNLTLFIIYLSTADVTLIILYITVLLFYMNLTINERCHFRSWL